ncbi:MAG: DUF4230 domain-containing protein [Microcoleaceae cyanobacterium]
MNISANPIKTMLILGLVGTGMTVSMHAAMEKIRSFSLFTSTTETKVNVVYAALQEVGELTTVKQPAVEIVHKAQDRKILGRVPVGSTRVIYYATGEIQAGFDLNQVVVRETNAKQVEVVLPPPHISNAFIDIERSKNIYSEKRWLGPDTELKLQEEAQQEALSQMVQNACAAKILDVANERAEETLETFLKKSGLPNVMVKTQVPLASNCSSISSRAASVLPSS